MFSGLRQNLSKNQKIGVVVILQIILIVLIASAANIMMRPRENVAVVNENTTSIPDDNWQGIKNELWNLLKDNIAGLTRSKIDNATIREGTYEEFTNDEITTAKFLLDIDSIKQTYAVTVSWSDKVEIYNPSSINCPSLDQMKYPDVVCHGMNNDSYSMDLYFPYDGYDDEGNTTWTIEGDEATKTITVISSVCDPDKYNAEALWYIEEKTPYFENPDYSIVYEINTVDEPCLDDV